MKAELSVKIALAQFYCEQLESKKQQKFTSLFLSFLN